MANVWRLCFIFIGLLTAFINNLVVRGHNYSCFACCVISNLSLDLNSIFLYNLFLLFFLFSLVTLHLEEKICFVTDYATIFYGRLWCSI